MSWYTSKNTKILAEVAQAGGNTRMLLMHTREDGSNEYVIGSYFREDWGEGNVVEYSWDWGHYFQDPVAAIDYWKSEVLWSMAEIYEVSCDDDEKLDGAILQVTFSNAQWCAKMCYPDGSPMMYRTEGFTTKSGLLEAFRKHRPTCRLECKGWFMR